VIFWPVGCRTSFGLVHLLCSGDELGTGDCEASAVVAKRQSVPLSRFGQRQPARNAYAAAVPVADEHVLAMFGSRDPIPVMLGRPSQGGGVVGPPAGDPGDLASPKRPIGADGESPQVRCDPFV